MQRKTSQLLSATAASSAIAVPSAISAPSVTAAPSVIPAEAGIYLHQLFHNHQDRKGKMIQGHRRNKTAFTLIELLVVITIITLLISILLPALAAARSAARQVACQSNLRQIGMGLYLYGNDHDGYLPAKNGWWWYSAPSALAGDLVNNDYLPSDDTSIWGYTNMLLCPDDPNAGYYKNVKKIYPLSYRYRQSSNGARLGISANAQPLRIGIKPSGYKNYMIWWVTELHRTIDSNIRSYPTNGDSQYVATPYSGPDTYSYDSVWHEKGTNALYEDGHVSFVSFGLSQSNVLGGH